MAASNLFLTARDMRVSLNKHGDVLVLDSEQWNQNLFTPAEQPVFAWLLTFRGENQPSTDWNDTEVEISDMSVYIRGWCSKVRGSLRVAVDDYGVSWQIDFENQGETIADTLGFLLKGPFSFDDLRCTFPFCSGWEIPLASLEPGDRFELHYPVQAAMQWVSLYNASHGIYFGVHDKIPLYKTLTIGQVEGKPFISWQFTDLDLHPGEKISLPPVYLCAHAGSWHEGANIYRAWASQHIASPKIPVWLEKNPSWAWVGLKGQLAEKPWHSLAFLPEFSQQVAEDGVELVQLTAYTDHGHDTLYPDYLPGPSLGGEIALQAAVGTIHRSGKRVSIYVNGRVVDPASSLDPEKRCLWGVQVHPGDQPYRERYGEVTFDVMCPGAANWQEHFIEKMAYLVRTFDVDGIYVDQVCGCTSLPCYTPGHTHAKPNLAWSAYMAFLVELRSRLMALKPDLFLATEGVNDIFGQYFDLQQAHNDWSGPLKGRGVPLDDLYRFTFPGHLLEVGCITGEANNDHYLRLAHLLGGGCDFGVWDWSDLSEEFQEQARAVIGWHRRYATTLRYGEIIKLVNTHHIQVNAFISQDQIIVCGASFNKDETAQTTGRIKIPVPLPDDRRINRVHFMDSGAYNSWGQDKTRVNLELQAASVFGAALELSEERKVQKS